mgnify:CR=1 FL=1
MSVHDDQLKALHFLKYFTSAMFWLGAVALFSFSLTRLPAMAAFCGGFTVAALVVGTTCNYQRRGIEAAAKG